MAARERRERSKRKQKLWVTEMIINDVFTIARKYLLPFWVFSTLISGCSPKIDIHRIIDDENSELLALLIQPTDIESDIAWHNEILSQENKHNEDFENAYIILNGKLPNKTPIYASNSLTCFPNIKNLRQFESQFESLNFDDMEKFNTAGLESLYSCQVHSVQTRSIAECVYWTRYQNMVSTITTRIEDNDYSYIKNLGDKLVSVVDKRVANNDAFCKE